MTSSTESRRFWRWTITDELTGKRRETRYLMSEETARERFGEDAVKVEGSLEVRQVSGEHTSSFLRSK